MTTTLQKIDDLRSHINVHLEKKDYEPQVQSALKKYSKQIQVKGFRPGMVPIGMVKKMYGNGVLAEELNRILSETAYKYIEENKLEVLAQPIPAENQSLSIDINNLQDVDYAFEIGHAPEVDLGFLESTSAFTKYEIEITDKMIDDEVDRIRKRFATYEYPDSVAENDIVSVLLEELDESGNVKEGGVNNSTSLMTDMLKDDAKSILLSLKNNDTFNYNIFELMDRDREAVGKNVLNITIKEELDAVGDNFKFTITNITRSKPAELNQEFFDKVYGEGKIATEQEMRDFIKNDLKDYFDGRTDSQLINEIYKVVMDKSDFPLPDSFLKRWIELTNEKPITKEQVENDYPAFAKGIRWSLIKGKVMKQQNLEVTEEDVKNKVRSNVIYQLYGYGLSNIGDEWIENFVEKQMADKQHVRRAVDQIEDDKVLDFIKSKVLLQPEAIALDAFNELISKSNEQ
jgi:trigger factor